MSKSHLFLKNEFGISRIFNRTRGRDDNEETLEDGKNYSHQRENFHRCRIEFDQSLENRHISRDEIEKVQNQISIIFRCSGRDYWDVINNPFSFVLTIEQKNSAELDGNSLYDSLEQINVVEAIAQATLEAEV